MCGIFIGIIDSGVYTVRRTAREFLLKLKEMLLVRVIGNILTVWNKF